MENCKPQNRFLQPIKDCGLHGARNSRVFLKAKVIQASSQLNPDRDKIFKFSGQSSIFPNFGQANFAQQFRFGAQDFLLWTLKNRFGAESSILNSWPFADQSCNPTRLLAAIRGPGEPPRESFNVAGCWRRSFIFNLEATLPAHHEEWISVEIIVCPPTLLDQVRQGLPCSFSPSSHRRRLNRKFVRPRGPFLLHPDGPHRKPFCEHGGT